MNFHVIENIHEFNLFFFNCNYFFFQKVQIITLNCRRNQRIGTARRFRITIFYPKIVTIFGPKNNIKAETSKTTTTATDSTRNSRFRYIKIWIYSINLRKHILKF